MCDPGDTDKKKNQLACRSVKKTSQPIGPTLMEGVNLVFLKLEYHLSRNVFLYSLIFYSSTWKFRKSGAGAQLRGKEKSAILKTRGGCQMGGGWFVPLSRKYQVILKQLLLMVRRSKRDYQQGQDRTYDIILCSCVCDFVPGAGCRNITCGATSLPRARVRGLFQNLEFLLFLAWNPSDYVQQYSV